MKHFLFIYFIVLNFNYSYSQQEIDTTKVNSLEEVIISTSKFSKNKKVISQKTEVIGKKEIEFQNFQNTADMLQNSGTLSVQKSQQGGGSPIIRGLEASRILLLVDGIRMNNLIFRTGHLQNIITVDENMLENTEVFFGSSSTLFGSDALGGAINLNTKKPKFSNEKNMFSGTITSRFSSVNKEKSIAGDVNFGTHNFASLTSFSFNDFDDLKMGKNKNHRNPYFGERNFFVETINGIDVLVENDNKYVQKFSGYRQYNFMQKFAYNSINGSKHEVNFQYSTSSTIPRYDRLTDVSNSTILRNAQWYYGPQKRLLAIYSFSKNATIFNSNLNVDASYQNVEESRHNRNFGNYFLQNRKENVSVFGLNISLKKKFSKSDIVYGVESYYDDLKSVANKKNINSGEIQSLDTRYPNGKNNMLRTEVFGYFSNEINSKTNWNIGGRIGNVSLKSIIADNSIFNLPFDKIKQQNFIYSTTIGLIHNPSKIFSIITNISSGFRVPNIDDLAKIFETSNNSLIVPNENLKPEKSITVDFGFNFYSPNKRFTLENTFFYTHLKDVIITDTFTYNGASTINYNGNTATVFANQNKQKAFITGFSSNVKVYLVDNLLLNATFNSTYGRIKNNGTKNPLDHIPPMFGKIGLNYFKQNYGLEVYVLYNGKKPITDYFLNGEDNEQYAPENGMPAWETYNAKAFVKIFNTMMLFTGIENILDTQYRTFASGMNAAGRNYYISANYSF